jgi:hypothetical protein
MFRTTLITLTLALATPVLAAGPATPTNQFKAPAPTQKKKFDVGDVHDFLVAQCHIDGGGMISGSDGAYHCVDPQGRTLW